MLISLALFACTTDKADDTSSDTAVVDTSPPVDTGPVDEDGDGVAAAEDCDDGDPGRYPGADEVCDEVDNDCDDQVDEEAVDQGTWYADADADGYGDSQAPEGGCEQPTGTVDDATDCDDSSDDVFPGNAEVCDGLDNDCDEGTSEDGLVTWTDASAAQTDLTDFLAAGTVDAPVEAELASAGTLAVCAGTWYALFETAYDLDLIGPAGADATVIDAGGQDAVLSVVGEAAVAVSGLTLSGGEGGDGFTAGYGYGGGIQCGTGASVAATVSLSDVTLSGNHAYQGGGLYVNGCTVTGGGVDVVGNTAGLTGGGVHVTNGSVVLAGGAISGNVSEAYGGGLYVDSYLGPASADLSGVRVSANEAETGAGAALNADSDPDAEMTCAAGEDSAGAFAENSATSAGGGVAFLDGGTLHSTACDWSKNAPDDVGGDTTAFGADASFSCTGSEGCTSE